MPLRSHGCYKCRSRKIRCDQTRPFCQRCATHGVQCPGYKTERPGDIEIRDETSLTTRRASQNVGESRFPLRKQSSESESSRHNSSSSRSSSILTLITTEDASTPSTRDDQISLPDSSPASIWSPAVQRVQLRSMFLRFFMSHNFLPEDSGLEYFHFDYARALTALPSASPVVGHALDSLSLVQVGSVHKDRTLLHEGVKAYTRSLRSLAIALSRPKCQYDDNILAAATILSLCEFYDEIKQQGHGWISHQQGMQKLIEARGPDSINSHLAQLLYWNTVNASVASALMWRKPAALASPKWQAMESKLFLNCAHGEAYEIGRALPALLERHDQLDQKDPNILCDLDALIGDCEELEDRMLAYYSPYRNSASPLKPVEHFPTFFSAIPDHVLTHAHDFPSFAPAFMYSQYLLRIYFLRNNLQSLYALRRKLVPDEINAKFVEDAALFEVVVRLCRCIPYFVEPPNGTVGHVSCFFPMHVAAYYFHARKLWRWLRWIRHVTVSVFNRGLSMPIINMPVLPAEEEEEMQHAGKRDY